MSNRVLIVEDDADLREALVEALEDEGFEVHQASSGAEALSLAPEVFPCLVVADVRMEGMDGLECLARLRDLCPDARSIVMTGYASRSAPGRAIEVQASDYLYKPFSLEHFLMVVRRVLASGRERERYSNLLHAVVYRARSAAPARSEPPDPGILDKLRDLVFSSYYVGIRSGQLNDSEALYVFDHLESLERRRRDLLQEPEDEAGARRELVEGYTRLNRRIATLSQDEYVFRERRKTHQVDPRVFRSLYDRVRSGEVPAEHLMLAPLLRRLAPADLEEMPELAELRTALWAAGRQP